MLYLLIFILMCFLIPSFFTSMFVISVAILPAIGTGLAVGLAVFIVIIIFKSIFSSKKTETSTPHSITDSNKTYQLFDEEFDMTNNCNTNDFTTDVNAIGLCGSKDWKMPTRDELLTLLHCAKNQNTSPKTDSDFNRLCTDEALKDAPNINKTYFPNTASHFWTSTLTNSDPWVVVFSYGGANADNKYFDSPVRLVRNDKPKLSKKVEKKMVVKEDSSADFTGTYYLKTFENCCFEGETKISKYNHLQLDNPIDVDLIGDAPPMKNVDKVQLGSSEDLASSIKNGTRLKVHCDSLQVGFTGHYALPVYCVNAKIYNTEKTVNSKNLIEKKMFINAVEKHARSVRGAFYPESLKIKTNGDVSIATYVVEGACDNDTQSTIGTCGNHWEQYMIGLTDNNIIKPIEIGAKGSFAYETIKFIGNFIELDGKTVGEKDALCCPTVPMKKKFEISKDGFREITS